MIHIVGGYDWLQDEELLYLRELGARVLYRQYDRTTHIVTELLPPAPTGPAAWMSDDLHREYARAVKAAEGRSVEVLSMRQLDARIDAVLEAARRPPRRQVCLEQRESPLPGFVGF